MTIKLKDNISKYIFFLFVTYIFLFCSSYCLSADNLPAGTFPRKKIMIIHSYHPEFWWVHSVDKGMLEVFSEHNFNAEYFYEFLDTKRFLNDFFNTYFSQYKKYLSIKFSAQKPDLIITVDDDALNFMKSCRTEIFGKDIPIVFCGVNKPFDYSILKGKSITGVMEILDIEETIDSIIKIHPDVKRLAVITDLTTNGKNNRLLLEQLEKKYYQKLKFVFIDRENKGLTLDELINEIKNLDNNTAIYLADFFNDRNGYIDQDIVIPLICRNASRPVYSPYIMMFRYGTVGGKLNDPELQGRKAAELTLKYFSGMKIEDIPVFTESINKFMFNFNELKRWKINESELPENSVIINKMPKWFDRHFKYIFPFIFIILALIIVIFVIVINGKKLKRKEIELSISEKKYRLLFESESDAIILIDMDSLKIIEANNAATDLYKYSKDELIGMPAFQLSNEPEKTEYRIKNSEQLEFIRIRYHKDKNGFVFPVEITARIFALDDKKLLLIAVRDIRDRIEREQALKEKTDELDRFFNLSLDLMCIADFNGFFKRLNPAWKAVLGYDEKELLSKKFIDFIHPDDLPATYSSIKKLEEGEDIINFINRYRCFDGSYKFIEWRSTPYKKNMIYAAARDITEHIQAEKAARESEKKYRLLFENMSSGFALHTIICDENENPVDYRFIEINEPFERLTGLKKKDIIGKTVTEALPLTEKYWIETYGKVALTGNHIIFENYSAALEKYYECIAFSPEKYQFAVLFNDITDRKKIEHEREKLINELEIKNAEMERFVYTVSHDLRSPLITISSFVGLLAQDITKNDLTQVHNDLTRISNAVKKMNALLYDLLELSRIGRVANLSSYFSLTEAANEAVEFLQALITEKKAEIIIESSLPQIFGDKRRIIEVLQNLIENALKFSNPGTDIRIEIGFSPEKNAFFVKDNGIGVNPKYHKKIFGLFDKLESKSEGTGIGLAIVSRIIEVHKGKIWVESEGNGKGSYFYFTINFSG